MSNTTVLITGADGFIGSHLTELLLQQGHKVRALSYYNSFNSWGWLDTYAAKYDSSQLEVISGDIRDPHFCLEITRDVDRVFHLAALIAIPYSYIAPSSYVDTNVTGTLNICQACRDNSVSRLVHTSTSEVYGTAQYVPIDEKHPLQPQSPYSASKISADAMAMSFHNAFELPLTIARPFNTYGPRQSARAVIPTIISQIAAGHQTIQVGDLSPTRDFNYVEDTCRGLLALAESQDSIGQTVNLGSNTEITVGDTLNLIKELMSSDVEFSVDSARIRPKNSEVFRLWCDNTLFDSLCTSWQRVSLREGLQRTIDWFADPKNLSQYKTNIYNV